MNGNDWAEVDVARIGAAEPQPGFLDGVVCLVVRAEHPIGHRSQAGSMFLKSLDQPFLFRHLSHSSFATCLISRPARRGR